MSWRTALPRWGSCWESTLQLLKHTRPSPPLYQTSSPTQHISNARFFSQTRFFRPHLSPPASSSKCRRYVLSRSFASGLFMFGAPNRAPETKAVVTSCSCSCTPSSVDAVARRTLLTERRKRYISLMASFAKMPSSTRGFHSDFKGPSKGGRPAKQSGKRNASSKPEWKGNNSYLSSKSSKKDKYYDKDKSYDKGKSYEKDKLYDKEKLYDKDKSYDRLSVSSQSNSIKSSGKYDKYDGKPYKAKTYKAESAASSELGSATTEGAAARKSKESKGVMNRISHMHLASKEELLAAASSAWERMKIRFKWLTIRQVRPYTFDEISAFLSALLVGHLLWIILGTTTFFSIALWLANTVRAQEYLAGMIGNYLTKETGVRVVFESAIVPRWKDGCISFKNVYVSRRPGALKGKNVQKGSRAAVIAAAASAAPSGESELDKLPMVHSYEDEEDQNYTQFDLSINTVNVTLSVAKWMNGRGLLSNVEIKGVRGVVDRTHVHWDPDIDARSLRHTHQPGDFEIDAFRLEDLLVTLYQPGGFRPFAVSIYSCDLPQLRKQWLFYDFLSASHVSGSYDDSLFTIHPRQTHGVTFQQINDYSDEHSGVYPWKKTSRLRIDGLNIDHLNTGVAGPFGWIQTGNVDIVADVMFPVDSDEGIGKIFQDLMDKMEHAVAHRRQKFKRMVTSELDSVLDSGASDQDRESKDQYVQEPTGIKHRPATIENITAIPSQTTIDKRYLIFDLRLQLNDPYAAVPLFNSDLSYVNNALVRPIVAYINSTRTWIPVNCRVVKSLNEFDGSWTVYDSGLMDDLSAETYEAFARDVADANMRKRRMRAVGLWSLQVFMNAFMAAFASAMLL